MKPDPTILREPSFLGAAILGSGLLLVLALDGGGYNSTLFGQIGVLIWWVLLLGCATGLLPTRIPGQLAIATVSLFTLFVVWIALSLIWSESFERTLADLARVATYLGVLLLSLAIRTRYGVRRMVTAVGVAIVTVAAVALVTRLIPDLYPAAADTARYLPVSGNRLGFPLNYWNGLGAFLAMGLPLMLYVATSAKSKWAQATAASAIPLLGLAIFLTYSRSAVGASVIAIVLFYVLCGNRMARLPVLLASMAGTGILAWLASSLEFVAEGPLSRTGETGEGLWMLAATLVVCGAVGSLQFLVAARGITLSRIRLNRPSPAVLLGGAVAAVGIIVIVALATGLPGKADEAWSEFKRPGSAQAQGPGRLQSFSGNHRYQFWEAAVEQNRSRPVTGRGPGTFELWSNRSDQTAGFVRDAHSLYLETLGELGIVGFILLMAFVFTILIGGWLTVRRSSTGRRGQMAAVYSACVVLIVVSAVDWTWELPVVSIAFLLLVSVLVSAGDSGRESGSIGGRLWVARGVVSLLAIGAIGAIAIPTASSSLVEQSQEAARDGDFQRAMSLAVDATAVEPAASTPYLQQALVLERLGFLREGLVQARNATSREPTNWRPWIIQSRLEAATGEFEQAVRSFEQASSLRLNSPLLDPR